MILALPAAELQPLALPFETTVEDLSSMGLDGRDGGGVGASFFAGAVVDDLDVPLVTLFVLESLGVDANRLELECMDETAETCEMVEEDADDDDIMVKVGLLGLFSIEGRVEIPSNGGSLIVGGDASFDDEFFLLDALPVVVLLFILPLLATLSKALAVSITDLVLLVSTTPESAPYSEVMGGCSGVVD